LFKKILRICVNIELTFYLLLLISLNLVVASFYVKAYFRIFGPLNNLPIQDWFRLYGRYHPGKIWWLLTLSGLLIALGLNIASCTIDRLIALWSSRDQITTKVLFLRTSPSLIHICFSIVLTGHLLSAIAGLNNSIDVIPGRIAALPSHASARVMADQCDYYSSPHIISGYIKQCTISVEMETSLGKIIKRIGFLEPLYWHGLTFHLIAEKKPGEPKMRILVKKDPGVKLILWGLIAVVLLMLWYFPQMNRSDKRR
jgi:hypothetical protein